MIRKVFVFDFDGTLTVPVDGADGVFLRAHQEGFAALVGRSLDWVVERYAAAREIIAANPNLHGWDIGGRIVAPALVDIYVEARVCAQIVLRQMGEDLVAWDACLDALYQEHYLKFVTDFRPELVEVLSGLRRQGIPFYIVTNSDPVKVQKRLEVLGVDAAWIAPQVRGDAKKFVVTPGEGGVPEVIAFPGLSRPVYVSKRHYHRVLSGIMNDHGFFWSQVTVVGDIAELDLAFPVEVLRANGCLMLGPNTPDYEQRWAISHPRVRIATNLYEAVA